jgi:hypothetical protein
MNWAVGVTTVPSRIETLLPTTLNSLCDAGFDTVQLFVDGCNDIRLYDIFERLTTYRSPPALSITGNWILSAWELYLRNPKADRYAIFQDDIECVYNLREYLERSKFPIMGYCNLYMHKANKKYSKLIGWNLSNQRGLGALGLVFDKDGIEVLLTSKSLFKKPQDKYKNRRLKLIDGGIVTAMNSNGYKEYFHNPSLLQHIGDFKSTLGNNSSLMYQPPTLFFPGITYDALDLLKND